MSKKSTKRYLMLLAAIGLIAVALGTTGTFATFNAQTTNTGNYFATGTLLLHNNGGTTTCTSEAGSLDANNASGNGCDTLFHMAPLTSTAPQWAHLTLSNAGNIDAADIQVSEPGGCSIAASSFGPNTLTAPLPVAGTSLSTLHFTSLTGAIAAGDAILVTEGTHAQTFTATAAATAGTTSVAVTPVLANFSYTTSASLGVSPTFGTDPNLCNGLEIVIVETADNTFNGDSPTGAVSCSYGVPDGPPNNTGCSFDASKTLGNLSASPVPLLDHDASTSTTLTAGKSRFFLIGIQPTGSFDNTYQNRRAAFDLRWRIDQA